MTASFLRYPIPQPRDGAEHADGPAGSERGEEALTHVPRPGRRLGVGSRLPRQRGCLPGAGSETVGTQNPARQYGPLVLAHAIDPHVPEWWASPTDRQDSTESGVISVK